MMSPATPSAIRATAGRGVRSSLLPPFCAIEENLLRSENDNGLRLGKPGHREPRIRTPPVAASRPSSHSDSARALSLLHRTPPERAQTSRTRTPPAPQITAKVAAGRHTPSTASWATSEINCRRRSWPPFSSPEFASSSALPAPFSSFPIREFFSQMPNVSSNTTVDVDDAEGSRNLALGTEVMGLGDIKHGVRKVNLPSLIEGARYSSYSRDKL